VRKLIASLILWFTPALVHAQSVPVQIRGHFIGEPVERFIHLEADVREELEVCDQHPRASFCQQLVGAMERGDRTEISASITPDLDHPDASKDTINFVLEGKKLVKMTMLLNDMSDVAALGHPSSESDVASHGAAGAKWTNHLTTWDMQDCYATVYQDNNPSLEDRRPIFTMESREEHARESTGGATAVAAKATPAK